MGTDIQSVKKNIYNKLNSHHDMKRKFQIMVNHVGIQTIISHISEIQNVQFSSKQS